jgi:tryptophan halogenase
MIYDLQGFREQSHLAILTGLGVQPKAYDPMVELLDLHQVQAHFWNLRNAIARAVDGMQDHAQFLQKHAAAVPVRQVAA